MREAANLWQNPSWFLKDIDLDQGNFEFRSASRTELSEASFLDDRFFNNQDSQNTRQARPTQRSPILQPATGSNDIPGFRLPFKDIPTSPRAPAPGCFLFHTAFCCSTLLARVLDLPGKVLALKEPGVVMKLSNLNRMQGSASASQLENLNQLTLQLLCRRFQPQEQILVKPTNAANNLLDPVLRSGARILLLYSDLPSFLVSVIKKGEPCRYFVRHLLNILRLDRADIDAWPERQRLLLTDLQVAALVWSIQIDLFEHILQTAPEQQVYSLNADTFLTYPAQTLTALNAFFELGYSPENLRQLKNNPRFKQHAKFSDKDYDTNIRLEERVQIETLHKEAIATTLDWARRLRNDHLPSVLTHGLPGLGRLDAES